MGKIIFTSLVLFGFSAMAVDLGAAAKAAGAKAMDKGKDVMAACQQDQIKFCKSFKEMEAIKTCLKENKEKLSPGCKASMGL